MVDLGTATKEEAEKYGVEAGSKVLKHDFVLVTDQQSADLRNQKSMEALAALGRRCRIVDGLPVPEVD